MGYNQNAVSQFMFIGTPFQQVGGADNATLIDLKVNCPEDEDTGLGWLPNADAVVQLDANGSFVRKLVYIPTWLAEAVECTRGWYDEVDFGDEKYDTNYNNLPIPFGSAFQVCVSGEGAKATFSGEVKSTATITDVAGFMGVAICAPKAMTLGELKVNCPEDEDTGLGWLPNADAVVQLDANGSFVRKLVYIPTWLAEAVGCTKGWYDEVAFGNEDYSTRYDDLVSWAAGEGFQVCVSGEGATVQIDSALAE